MTTAKQAIQAWYKQHPKTHCPVVGESICRHGGCDNARLRADHRCNIELKTGMAERARAAADPRPWLADLRLSADNRRYVLNFPFDRLTIADFKSVIPDADRAYDMGLVNRVVEPDELEDTVLSLAREIAANSPLSLEGNKRILRTLRAIPGDLPDDVERELVELRESCFRTEDFREGIKAFGEKRRPEWKGR